MKGGVSRGEAGWGPRGWEGLEAWAQTHGCPYATALTSGPPLSLLKVGEGARAEWAGAEGTLGTNPAAGKSVCSGAANHE